MMATLGSWRQGITHLLAHKSTRKTMAQLVAGASTQTSPWKRVALPQLFASPVLPLGEGAYLSGKAVAQRTTDQRKHCEEGKWPECYATGGDYIDHKVPEAPAAVEAP